MRLDAWVMSDNMYPKAKHDDPAADVGKEAARRYVKES